jgi:hypothetical protein
MDLHSFFGLSMLHGGRNRPGCRYLSPLATECRSRKRGGSSCYRRQEVASLHGRAPFQWSVVDSNCGDEATNKS